MTKYEHVNGIIRPFIPSIHNASEENLNSWFFLASSPSSTDNNSDNPQKIQLQMCSVCFGTFRKCDSRDCSIIMNSMPFLVICNVYADGEHASESTMFFVAQLYKINEEFVNPAFVQNDPISPN